MFSGVYTAIVTPFRNGELDLDAFRALVREQDDAGISGIVIAGTTGEAPTISDDEVRTLYAAARSVASKRLQILLGAGSNSTAHAVEKAAMARDLKADGVLAVTPYYNKPPQEGLYRHFEAVAAAAAPLGVILYNVPGRTGINLEIDTVVRLAAIPNVTALKEASGNLSQIARACEKLPKGFSVLSGDDALTLAVIDLGGVGVISVASNVEPKRLVCMVEAARAGRTAEAQAAARALAPLVEALFLEPNPIPVKTAFALRGRIAPEFRLPLVPMSDAPKAKLAAALEALSGFPVTPPSPTLGRGSRN